MTYVDSSVILAYLFNEPRQPDTDFWHTSLISSRLSWYEVWNRVHARNATSRILESAFARVEWLGLEEAVLRRAVEPFPGNIRTPDGLHLATLHFVRTHLDDKVSLATYDRRMAAAARAMGVELHDVARYA